MRGDNAHSRGEISSRDPPTNRRPCANIEHLAHSAAALPTQEPDRTDSILTEPDSVRQSRARDRRVALTEIGRLLKEQYNALATPVPHILLHAGD